MVRRREGVGARHEEDRHEGPCEAQHEEGDVRHGVVGQWDGVHQLDEDLLGVGEVRRDELSVGGRVVGHVEDRVGRAGGHGMARVGAHVVRGGHRVVPYVGGLRVGVGNNLVAKLIVLAPR